MAPSLGPRACGVGELVSEAAELDTLFEQLSHRTFAVGAQLCHTDALVARPDAVPVLDRLRLGRRAVLTHASKRYAAGTRKRIGHHHLRSAGGRDSPQRPDQSDVPDGVRE